MNKRRVIILANGAISKKDSFKDFFSTEDYIICADGGLKHAEELGLIPDLIIGDLDSCQDSLKNYSCKMLSFPREKDKTDTELALEYSQKIEPDEVFIIGALGKRLDHTLANVYLILKEIDLGYPVILLDSCQQINLIHNTLLVQKALIGETISLIPVTQTVSGITTSGLKYGLNEDTLYRGDTRGISNEITELPVSIRIKRGLMLFIRNFLDKSH